MTNAALSLVADSDQNGLSEARRFLKQAQDRRLESQAAFEEITRQHRRIEGLIGNGKPALDAKIADLERRHSEMLEQWSLKPDGPEPELVHFEELELLKKQSRLAEIKDTSARAALAKMNAELIACQEDSARAIATVRSAANDVLMATAKEMIAELEVTERRSATLRGYLEALGRHYQLEGMRKMPGGELSNIVQRMMPRGPFQMSDQGLNEAVERWQTLAGRLMVNETANMELPK
jgi:hypothetical protein